MDQKSYFTYICQFRQRIHVRMYYQLVLYKERQEIFPESVLYEALAIQCFGERTGH
jgi:hypothetical protein